MSFEEVNNDRTTSSFSACRYRYYIPKRIIRKDISAVVYDQKLSDVFDLSEQADQYLNTGKLREAILLVDQQLRIDSEHPTPYAQLGRYYQLRAIALSVRPGAVFVSEYCPTCKGNRFNLINEDARSCEICSGTGRVPAKGMVLIGPSFVRCPACGGTGWD